jgi:aminopeptidase N
MFLQDYFQIKFPLPKIDMIAVPDFAAGAMEVRQYLSCFESSLNLWLSMQNWGLITYRETALLYRANASTLSAKHRVAEVIAHELAHQWFGNLVTM